MMQELQGRAGPVRITVASKLLGAVICKLTKSYNAQYTYMGSGAHRDALTVGNPVSDCDGATSLVMKVSRANDKLVSQE